MTLDEKIGAMLEAKSIPNTLPNRQIIERALLAGDFARAARYMSCTVDEAHAVVMG